MNRRWMKLPRGSSLMAGLTLALLAAVALAWPPADSAEPVKLEKLRWMTGAWRCDDPKEPLEEHWTEARNGVMVGMARIGDDPDRAVYEIILIEERAPAPLMSIRHFGKGLYDRDKRAVIFKLTKADAQEAVFEDPSNDFPSKIIYRLAGDPGARRDLLVRLVGTRGGQPATMDFPMQRVK